jgi:hypothetical protein
MNYLTNEKRIEEIVDEDYFCQFDFQLNNIAIKFYQLFEHLSMMNDDQRNILISKQDFISLNDLLHKIFQHIFFLNNMRTRKPWQLLI